jgi:lipid-A-disaccharide synthase
MTYRLARHLVSTEHFSLPNLLADTPLVREFIQDDVTTANLGSEMLDLLDNAERRAAMQTQFRQIHATLRRNASQVAANAVLQVAGWTETDDGR